MNNQYKWISDIGADTELTYINYLRTCIYNWASVLLTIYLTLHSIDIYITEEPGLIISIGVILIPLLTLYLNYKSNYLWAKINLTWLLAFITFIYWILYGLESGLGFSFFGFFLGAAIAYDNKNLLAANLIFITLLVIIGGLYNIYYDNSLSEYVSNFDIVLNYGITFALLAGAILYFIFGLKSQEEKLLDQQERLTKNNFELLLSDKKNKNKTELLKMIAHDLRGPISSYKNLSKKFNYLIRHNDVDNILQIAEHMEKSGDRLFSNIDNLLNWVLTQQHNITVDKKYISTHDIISEVISELDYVSQPKEIKFDNTIPITCMVYSDRNMLRIILRNLIDNAIKYSPEKSLVEIQAIDEGSDISIIIKDSSSGIKTELLNHLKTKENLITLSNKGYGLGLTICYFFAEILDVQLSINNNKDSGVIAKVTMENVL